jgi:ATP-dependent exoDNAse (exonuclease V) alpha subunit
MKKLILIALALAAAGGAAYYQASHGSEKAMLRKKSARFMECLKFKEFAEAAAFHSAAEVKAHPDIPKQLENFFKIPHENLDIQETLIDYVELDSTGARAKVKTTSVVRILNRKDETQRPEAMLYWKKDKGAWVLDLRTTLERGL